MCIRDRIRPPRHVASRVSSVWQSNVEPWMADQRPSGIDLSCPIASVTGALAGRAPRSLRAQAVSGNRSDSFSWCCGYARAQARWWRDAAVARRRRSRSRRRLDHGAIRVGTRWIGKSHCLRIFRTGNAARGWPGHRRARCPGHPSARAPSARCRNRGAGSWEGTGAAPTVEQIDTQLTSSQGSGSWAASAGTTPAEAAHDPEP